VVTATRTAPDEVEASVGAIPDPEVPVLTIADLGILRSVMTDAHTGVVEVVVTPTYSGCPAMEAITAHVEHVCRSAGWEPRVTTRLSPAWTTDWMSPEGKEKLRRFGIAPPSHTAGPVPVTLGRRTVDCPRCGSPDTVELAHFGSTACKALRRCEACRETFDEFKTL
jgi:ring-1,2-phenylacetyl-CoA epoxidase subunit PaaD